MKIFFSPNKEALCTHQGWSLPWLSVVVRVQGPSVFLLCHPPHDDGCLPSFQFPSQDDHNDFWYHTYTLQHVERYGPFFLCLLRTERPFLELPEPISLQLRWPQLSHKPFPKPWQGARNCYFWIRLLVNHKRETYRNWAKQ